MRKILIILLLFSLSFAQPHGKFVQTPYQKPFKVVYEFFFALEKLRPDIFLLDDGFQHRRIHRDLNILLLKKKGLFGQAFAIWKTKRAFKQHGKGRHNSVVLYGY